MKSIAVVFTDNPNRPLGLLNSVINRVNHLNSLGLFNIKIYWVTLDKSRLYSLVTRESYQRSQSKQTKLDNLVVNHISIKMGLLTNLLLQVRGFSTWQIYEYYYEKIIKEFEGADLITTHALMAGTLGYVWHKKTNRPYFVTWHGSDIHTYPFQNKDIFIQTKKILENASCNFFVSKALQQSAKSLTQDLTGAVLYNGISGSFKQYDKEIKSDLRKKYGCQGVKIVAFVGALRSVKNVLLLPSIFEHIVKGYQGKVMFWIIGGGELRPQLEEMCERMNVHFFGELPYKDMPELMNVIDVLVLPSKNEGLPLVTLEALSCGANVVGSDVGGISEAIGTANAFKLDDNFVSRITQRAVQMLEGVVKQSVESCFDWDKTAEKEALIYQKYLSQ